MNTIENIMKLARECEFVAGDSEAYDRCRQALRAAIKQALTPGEPVAWHPIETAPKDGTWILLYGSGPVDEGDDRTMAIAQYTNYLNGGETDWHWQFAWYDGGYYGSFKKPTHWMPIPPAPGTTAQPQREWVGLSDEDVRELDTSEFWDDHTPADFVRLVENKLREKNGGDRDWSLLEATQDSLREHMAMIHRDTALLRQALEALENHTAIKHPQQRYYRDAAITALRERLK